MTHPPVPLPVPLPCPAPPLNPLDPPSGAQVLPDGRVGFIDFGIVGRISEPTWRGLEALLTALPAGDYATMARALGAMGATEAGVDYAAFARDLESFFASLDALQGSLVVAAAGGGGGGGLAASLEVDQTAVNRLALELVRVGEAHGVRFPPDFGAPGGGRWAWEGVRGAGPWAHGHAAVGQRSPACRHTSPVLTPPTHPRTHPPPRLPTHPQPARPPARLPPTTTTSPPMPPLRRLVAEAVAVL